MLRPTVDLDEPVQFIHTDHELDVLLSNGGHHPIDDRSAFGIFAHNPGQADRCRLLGWEESAEHDLLKHRLALAARSVGAKTEFEVMLGDTCRADVVATLPSGTRWGLEAQLGCDLIGALDCTVSVLSAVPAGGAFNHSNERKRQE